MYLYVNLLETKGKTELQIRYMFIDQKSYIVFNESFINSIQQERNEVTTQIYDRKRIIPNPFQDEESSFYTEMKDIQN